jgi:hypothetical protein
VKILYYLLVPVIFVTAYGLYVWARNRQPSSLESGVDAFQREMRALSPDAAPGPRRRPEADPRAPVRRDPPRRPPTDSET